MTQRNATAMRQCGCFPACSELAYDVEYSLARWPGNTYEGDQTYMDVFYVHGYGTRFENDTQKHEMYAKYFDVDNRERSMRDFARINVYISDSSILKTVESEDYTVVPLLSGMGGLLGLWIGISIINGVEVLELVADIGLSFRQPTRSTTPHSTDQASDIHI